MDCNGPQPPSKLQSNSCSPSAGPGRPGLRGGGRPEGPPHLLVHPKVRQGEPPATVPGAPSAMTQATVCRSAPCRPSTWASASSCALRNLFPWGQAQSYFCKDTCLQPSCRNLGTSCWLRMCGYPEWNEEQNKWPSPSSHRGPMALLRSSFHQLHIPSSPATGSLLRPARG